MENPASISAKALAAETWDGDDGIKRLKPFPQEEEYNNDDQRGVASDDGGVDSPDRTIDEMDYRRSGIHTGRADRVGRVSGRTPDGQVDWWPDDNENGREEWTNGMDTQMEWKQTLDHDLRRTEMGEWNGGA